MTNEHSHRSYNVLTEDGKSLRRNRVHLRTTKEPFTPTADYDELEPNSDPVDTQIGPVVPVGSTVSQQHTVDTNPVSTTTSDSHVMDPIHISQNTFLVGQDQDISAPLISAHSNTTRPKRVVKKPRRLIEEA